jgi:hypothetical protein
MIKKAKAGDFVYAYRFNCEDNTYNVKKIKVKEDFNAESDFYIIYGKYGVVGREDAFWQYDEAEARYLVDLEKSQKKLEKVVKQMQKKINKIKKILLENQ